MNFLSIFVLIPLLMLAGLWAARGIKAIRGVMVTGASALLIASVVLTFLYLGERSAGNTAEMLFRADTLWYAPESCTCAAGHTSGASLWKRKEMILLEQGMHLNK